MAVDWWTLGCLMFEMVTGRGPFMSDDLQLLVRAITSTDPNIPSRVSAECAGAIRGLMNRSVDLRLDGIKIRSVPFYTGLDWDALFRMEIPAPYTPVDNEVDSDMSSHAEQRARLQVRQVEKKCRACEVVRDWQRYCWCRLQCRCGSSAHLVIGSCLITSFLLLS